MFKKIHFWLLFMKPFAILAYAVPHVARHLSKRTPFPVCAPILEAHTSYKVYPILCGLCCFWSRAPLSVVCAILLGATRSHAHASLRDVHHFSWYPQSSLSTPFFGVSPGKWDEPQGGVLLGKWDEPQGGVLLGKWDEPQGGVSPGK